MPDEARDGRNVALNGAGTERQCYPLDEDKPQHGLGGQHTWWTGQAGERRGRSRRVCTSGPGECTIWSQGLS